MEQDRIAATRERFQDYPAIQELIDELQKPENAGLVSFGMACMASEGPQRIIMGDPEESPLRWLESVSLKLDEYEPEMIERFETEVKETLSMLRYDPAA